VAQVSTAHAVFVVSDDTDSACQLALNALKGQNYANERVFHDQKEAELFSLRHNARMLEGLPLANYEQQRVCVWKVWFEADLTL
jgi:hypothetical protein